MTGPKSNAPVPPTLVPERGTNNRGGTGLLCAMIALHVSPLVPATTLGGSSATTGATDADFGVPTLAPALVAVTISAEMKIVEGIVHARSSNALNNAPSPSLTPVVARNENYRPQRWIPPVPHLAALQMLMVLCQAIF